MVRDPREETQQLRRELFELERLHASEKDCLLRVVNALGLLAREHQEMAEEVLAIKKLMSADGALPIDLVEMELRKLKEKIFSEDGESEPNQGAKEPVDVLENRLLETCRLFRKMIAGVVEDFYPLDSTLRGQTEKIHLDCHEDVTRIPFREATGAFLEYIEALKSKISKDFRYINRTFLVLLDQVKELEKSLADEFGGKEPLKQIEYFEMKINQEVGSIVNSFDIYTTINEVKTAVIEKIKNIKRVVSLKKKQDLKRTRAAQENIKKMQERIAVAESDAREMSRKAERLQMVAMKDGLTGLYNRSAFDLKVGNALNLFAERDEPFSLILFDIDKFKEINDSFGHVAGDKVLQKVAQSLRESFRENDFIARYGGDEFAVVIERLTKDMAREKIMNFTRNLAKRRFFSHKKGHIDVKVSAGIASTLKGDTAEKLIERADRAMYAVKHGRT